MQNTKAKMAKATIFNIIVCKNAQRIAFSKKNDIICFCQINIQRFYYV